MDISLRHDPSFAAARVTRNQAAFEAWIRAVMPGQTSGAGGGLLGGR